MPKELSRLRAFRKKGLTTWSLIFVIAFALVVLAVPMALGQNYAPGAQKGQWVYYGQISAFYQTNLSPPYTTSPYVTPFIGVASINSTVTDVTFDMITLSQIWSFNNGTIPRTIGVQGNVTSGIFQPSIGSALWFTAGGLSAPETLYRYSSPQINGTVVASFAGSSRAVNVWNCTCSVTDDQPMLSEVWDRTSGLLLGHAYNISYSYLGNYQDGSLEIKATQTNVPSTNPDFTLTVSNSVRILPNTTSTTRLTITAPDRLTVSLAITVRPTGLTCKLNPVRVEVLVVPTNSTPSCIGPLGTYQVTVNATSGARSHSQTVTYEVVKSLEPTILGVDARLFYLILVLAAAIAASTVLALLMRRRAGRRTASSTILKPTVVFSRSTA